MTASRRAGAGETAISRVGGAGHDRDVAGCAATICWRSASAAGCAAAYHPRRRRPLHRWGARTSGRITSSVTPSAHGASSISTGTTRSPRVHPPGDRADARSLRSNGPVVSRCQRRSIAQGGRVRPTAAATAAANGTGMVRATASCDRSAQSSASPMAVKRPRKPVVHGLHHGRRVFHGWNPATTGG